MFKQLNQIPFAAGQASGTPLTLDIVEPIIWLFLNLKVKVVTVVGTGTVKSIQDGVKRLLRLVQLTRGSSPQKSFGQNDPLGSAGVMLEIIQRSWLQGIPTIIDPDGVMAVPGTSIANGTHDVEIRYAIPISLPANRYHRGWVDRTALRVALETWQVQITWGTITDILALTGNATGVITVPSTFAKIAVIADPSLNPKWPSKNSSNMIKGGMILKSVAAGTVIGTAANGDLSISLPTTGNVLSHAQALYDDAVLDDALIKRQTFKVNESVEEYLADWDVSQGSAEFDGDNPLSSGLPVGFNMIVFDHFYNLSGRVNTNVAQSWKDHVDHLAATGNAKLIQQIMYLGAYEEGARR